jgi:6-phosphogluconolactonase (cycloisomerase 2 family)
MTILYCSSGNTLKVIDVDDVTGNLVRIVQTIEPIIDPLPEGVPTKGFMSPVTEWIEKHPTHSLVYAFTSFWSYHSAIVTTFQIVDPVTGALQMLGAPIETGGLHAAHVAFSPDGSTMCVGHHNDGNLCFFDCRSGDEAVGPPVRVVQTPEVRPETRTTTFPRCLPSIHHVHYSPDGTYLLASDSSKQGRVWTYAVDSRGLPSSESPTSVHRVTYVRKPAGWLTSVVTRNLTDTDFRIRRAVVHPDGNFVYLLMEFNAVVQVYEIDKNGKVKWPFSSCVWSRSRRWDHT